jgi:hypothetical protein
MKQTMWQVARIWTILEMLRKALFETLSNGTNYWEFIGHHISNLRNNYKKKTCWDFFWECQEACQLGT